MQRILLLSLAIILSYIQASSQGNGKSVIPPSPQTAEFDKYINYKISPYNGLPDISIPLYTIRLKGMDIPVSLSYHASGIKYRQSNGDVGVGWSLNPGYRVSRTVYGLEDDRYNMVPSLMDSIQAHNEGLDRDKFLSQLVNEQDVDFPQPVMPQSKIDGEYDLFNYSLPTESGSFFITDRQTKSVQTFEESNTKITYQKGTSSLTILKGFLNFDLTDDKGNKYLFGERNTNDLNYFESPPSDATLGTAWAMTDIITALGDQLKFKYNRLHVSGWQSQTRTESIKEGPGCWPEGVRINATVSSQTTGGNPYESFSLAEMISGQEKIILTRNAAGFITDLKVTTLANIQIKLVKFYYTNNPYQYQVFLDSIQVKDKNSTNIQTFRFDYYDKNYTGEIGADQWGFSQSGLNHTYLHNEIANDIIRQDDNGIPTPVTTLIGGFTNRILPTSDIYSLKSITYPTGGKTEYQYESNRYQVSGNATISGGGLRIRRITSNDLISNTMVHDFTYGTDGLGIPKMHVNESFFSDETAIIEEIDNYFILSRGITYSTAMLGDVSATGFTASLVSYPEVTETYSNGAKLIHKYSIGTEFEPGVLEIRLGVNRCGIALTYGGARHVTGYRFWDKPLLKEKIYLTADNDTVKKEVYEYASNLASITGLKVKVFARASGYNDVLYNYHYSTMVGSFFRYSPYTITYGKNLLVGLHETIYQGNNKITSTVQNQYNGRKQLAKVTTYTSIGEKTYTFLSYATDYIPGTDFIDTMVGKNIISEPIEKVEVKESIGGQYSILTGLITKYKNDNPALPESILNIENSSPVELSSFKFSNRSIGILPTNGSPAAFAPDNLYKTKITFDIYDSANNLVQTTKANNPPTTYIWDYNKNYPIAEISNAQASQVAYTSFEADGTGNLILDQALNIINGDGITGTRCYSNNGTITRMSLDPSQTYLVSLWTKNGLPSYNGYNGSTLTVPLANSWVSGKTLNNWTYREKELSGVTSINIIGSGGLIDEVRIYPKQAQMVTYTYNPLIGITGQCNINNQITYYEYDGLGRLSMIKDEEKNILKKICYNYYGEQEECNSSADPQWTSTGSTRCKPCALDPSFAEAIQQKEEKDVNSNSSSYNNTRWVDLPGPGGTACPIDPKTWQNVSEFRCKTINGLHTGEREQKQVNINPCSSQYSTTQWVNIGQNLSACPMPVGNLQKSQTFTRNNCSPGETAGTYTYVVAANKYMANSQAEADALAQQEIDQLGQSNANANATCNLIYYSDSYSGNYYRQTCGLNQEPVAYYVSVPANMFTSTLSKQDANNKALQYAQTQANQNGTCQALPMISVTSANYDLLYGYKVRFTNTSTQMQYEYQISYGGSTLGQIPAGYYDIFIYNPGGGFEVLNFSAGCGNYTAGYEAEFVGIGLNASCASISIGY